MMREFAFAQDTHPACPAYPGGHHLIVRRCYRSLELAVEPLNRSSNKNSTHRHHLPGIRNSKSDSYAEIGTDSLRTRLRTWCTSLPSDFFSEGEVQNASVFAFSKYFYGFGTPYSTLSNASTISSSLVDRTQMLRSVRRLQRAAKQWRTV